MNIFRHPINGSLIIWAYLKDGNLVRKIYYQYTLKEAMSKFRAEYPASERLTRGVNKVQWAPYIFI